MIKSSNINVMSSALFKAARILRRDFNEIEKLQNSLSKINLFVDRSINSVKEILFKELSKARPDWKIIFKEKDSLNNFKNGDDNLFVVKPISGLSNYSKGISYFSTSITLINKDIQDATVIYDPIKDELFYSEIGKGAFVNNFRIRTSSNNDLHKSFVVLEKTELLVEKIKSILEKKEVSIRIFGSKCLDFANLASGRIDCYVSSIVTNDYEPGLLLIKEAGGINSEMLELKNTIFFGNNAILDKIIKK